MISANPQVIIWNFTENCNYSCLHCYTRNREITEPDEETLYKIAQAIAQAKPLHVSFGGGEPLLKRKELLQCVRIIKEAKAMASVSTNGSTVTNKVAVELKDNSLDLLLISLDSLIEEKHNVFRNNKNAFSSVLNAVEVAKRHGIPFGFSVVISKLNFSELKELMQYCIDAGSTYISVKQFVPAGNGLINKDSLMLSNEEEGALPQLLDYIIQKNKDKGVTISIPRHLEFVPPEQKKGCLCGQTHLTVLPNGDMKMCAFGGKVLGNVLFNEIVPIWRKHPILVQKRVQFTCDARS